ncbi:tetratricopeptide [Ascobolus immersus RN42]|uniref:Tetratricopeptide n=1 Tax=Ascobolus immersus RN42 TaxID=1160509 RepID=A0A3N4HZZ4_ASCIM|nr:tetratricopeptide [Ascobolus immersus RN42]
MSSALDAFTLLPVSFDPETQRLSYPLPDPRIQQECNKVNALHGLLLTEDATKASNHVPPPPVPVLPMRSAAIDRLRKTGNEHFKKGEYGEAVRHYSFAIDMAMSRPPWEPSGLTREELHVLHSNRSQGLMGMQQWPEALIDAEISIEMKKQGNMKAHWRRAKCLREMGRLEEAKAALDYGLEFGEDADLEALRKDVISTISALGGPK